MDNKKNIVHYWGGSPVFIKSKWLSYLALINKCNQNGWNNWLVLSKKPDDPNLIDPFIKAGCKIIYQPRSKGNFDFSSIYRNFKFLRQIKCDVFHCYNDHTSPLIAAKIANVPVKIWSKLAMSSYYEKKTDPKGLQKLMLSTWVTCLCSNRIFAIADVAGKEICDQVGFKDKIATVYAPVALDRFIDKSKNSIRKQLNLEPSDIVITSVGHSVVVKGWDIAIEAFATVYKKFPKSKLLLVGAKTSPEYFEKLCLQIKKHNLEDRVVFTGIRNDIPEVLRSSNIFILPSRSEGMGAALVEAMAAGLPCVATASGGIPEVIDDGKNGFLFQRENANELAEKIINLISNPQLQNQLSNTAMKDLKKFEISTYVDIIYNHYQNMLNNISKK